MAKDIHAKSWHTFAGERRAYDCRCGWTTGLIIGEEDALKKFIEHLNSNQSRQENQEAV